MPQTAGQRRAAAAVEAAMAEREWNITDLHVLTGMDPGTIGDFLNGKRWPKIGNQGKFEKALGWEPGTIGSIARGGEPPLSDARLVEQITTSAVDPLEIEDDAEAMQEFLRQRAYRKRPRDVGGDA